MRRRLQLLNKENENSYPTFTKQPYRCIRGDYSGGRSIIGSRQVYRLRDLDFEAGIKDDIAVDWHIAYKDISSWYEYAENVIGVSGLKALPQLPQGS